MARILGHSSVNTTLSIYAHALQETSWRWTWSALCQNLIVVGRIWRGWARPGNAEAYEAHFRTAVLPHLSEVEGFRGARLLRGLEGDEVAFVAVTFFDSLDSIRAFAGSDLEAAVVEPEARRALSRFDGRCVHYTVVASDDGEA